MAKNVKRIILSEKQPRNKHIAWAKPEGDNIDLKIFEDSKWKPVAGGNSSTVTNKYPVDPNAPMLSMDNIASAWMEAATKLGFGTVSEPTLEQQEQIFNELKSYKFATPKQGNAVLIDHDLENGTFQCDDGSIITYNGKQFIGLRPDIDGYIIWKTTRDKLPVRESQEPTDPKEPNPGGGNTTESVNPGPSLKAYSGGGSGEETPKDTKEVYTVIDNNTGEIVDPLELHKLTNVIWYDYFGIYYPFYLNGVEDFNLHKDGIYSNNDYISSWVCMPCFNVYFTYLTVLLYYDYTLKPFNMSRINTTDNSEVSDINDFFNY